MDTYLSTIITDEEINRATPGCFNVIRAPRGYGKTTFMFDDRILKLAHDYRNVVYLIHNKITRDAIATEHRDKAVVFEDANDDEWFMNRLKRGRREVWDSENDDDNYVHVMCYQTFSALLRKHGSDWLNDIDLIIWDEFDDIKSFYESEIRRLKRLLPVYSTDKLVALLQEGNENSIVNFVYQMKQHVLDPAKICLLAISATPECAAYYFEDYINYILRGKLENKYDAKKTIFIDNVIAALKMGIIAPQQGKKFWCYTKYVHDAQQIESVARQQGFNALALWSPSNPAYHNEFTSERSDALSMIQKTGRAPDTYDFIITTGVLGRGVNVYDALFQDWICNSTEYEDVHQFLRARFSPETQYLLDQAKGLVEFVVEGIDEIYYEWHSLDEIRELLVSNPIYSQGVNPKRIQSIAEFRKIFGNKLEKRRFGSKHITQYRMVRQNHSFFI